MEDALTIREDIVIPGTELWFTASRSGGPGGQHVNKTSSKVTLHWDVSRTTALNDVQRARVTRRLKNRISREGVLSVEVDTERSQHMNRLLARERLTELVRQALKEPKRRVPTRVPTGAKRRRLEEKTKRGAVKRTRRLPRSEE